MNSTEIQRNNGWHSGYVEWTEGGIVYLSVVFSWHIDAVVKRAAVLSSQGIAVRIGGPAAVYAGISDGECVDVVVKHNLNACFTSRGCPYRCKFCIVGQTEGDLVELREWIPRPIVCDNNLTATSKVHFDRVVDSLKGIGGIDINQGLSAALITPHQASRLAELDMRCIRFAWDSVGYESKFRRGWDIVRQVGFPSSKITVYVLIGYNDTPDEALYRLETVRGLGGSPFPMRYQSLDCAKRNSFVGDSWTHKELVRFCRYWANLRITRRIPFAEFQYPYLGDSHGKQAIFLLY